jgi:hypothetical protein
VDEAARAYGRGVADLVAGIGRASRHLDRAVALDPGFLLAHVGLAVARAGAGPPVDPPEPVRAVSRGERQHAELVVAALAGTPSGMRRAASLRREHLAEYPGDLLVVALPLLVPGWR